MNTKWLPICVTLWMAMASIGMAEFLRDCHATDPKPYIHYATKTPYELINNEDSSPIFVAGCKPVMFWMAVRHGTQYPPSVDVNRMKDRLPKLRRTILQNHKERRGTLCQQDIDGLSNDGSIRIDDNVDETLTSSGREELLVLARRFRGRFAEFFNAQPAFTAQDYQFRHIAGSSASQSSARSFSRGIFTNGDVQLTEAPVGDRLVHFFENCTRWREQLEETGLLEQEIDLYRQGATFQSTLADVTTRLGFQYNMSAEDMLLIYDMCRYQKAWYLEQISPWCAAFTSENLKVLEYAEDLETYAKQGYGHQLNYQQACPLVEDLVNRIRVIRDNGTMSRERGLFYFTEGQGLLRLMARMGLAKDEQPLTYDMSPSVERKWKTSLMGSFAANVAVVLYNCSDDFKVQLFVKEDVIHLDQCQQALCTAKEFLNYLGPVADQCLRDDGCNPSSAVVPFTSSLAILMLVVIHLFVSFQITEL